MAAGMKASAVKGELSGSADGIRVVVRCRPFSAREEGEGSTPAVQCDEFCVSCQAGGSSRPAQGKTFQYDAVFGIDATQAEVFEACGLPVLENAFNAYNGCILAYGQTGAGKTFSTVGDVKSKDSMGILPRSCTRLFEMAAERKRQVGGFQFTVLATYLEIYNERLKDLLGSSKSDAGEPQIQSHPTVGAIVTNIVECPILNFQDATELLDFGAKHRAVASTNMNATSSRSHAVFTLTLRQQSEKTTGKVVQSQARLHFVDLAGSERQKKTRAEGDRLKEAVGINQSLTTLGRVISQLSQGGSKAVPAFRESKLTLLLKDALMGNSKTELLACISPAQVNLEETVGTLEFASRCKLVKTSAKRNEESKVDMIAQLAAEKAEIVALLKDERESSEALIRRLQEQLARAADAPTSKAMDLEQKRRYEDELDKMEQTTTSEEAILLTLDIQVGMEVAISERVVKNEGILKGVVRFYDVIQGHHNGMWVGIELALQKGKHNGTVDGETYFSCPHGHGLFVRKEAVLSASVFSREAQPGEYRLTADIEMQETEVCKSPHVCHLKRGMYVNVDQVGVHEGLVRGHIKSLMHPGQKEERTGWVSICNIERTQLWLFQEDCTDGETRVNDMRSTINAYSMRLVEMEEEERKSRRSQATEQELRAKLQAECEARESREKELMSQVQALQAAHESLALDDDDIQQLHSTHHHQRKRALSEIGLECSDEDPNEDMDSAPRLVNLHPDPALTGCLVFRLPLGQTSVGADSLCRVKLAGSYISGQVCTISNESHRSLHLMPVGGSLVHVNGRMVEEGGCDLMDGDRVAFGHAYIFQVQMVQVARRASMVISNDEFALALQEIRAGTEVDTKFQNCVEKALVLVKSDFGDQASKRVLAKARRASEGCAMANGALKQMPKHWRGGVARFELSIMFDAHGLPEVCVVARSEIDAQGGDSPDAASSASSPSGLDRPSETFQGGLRNRAGVSAGIWEVEQFWEERLPVMFEALSDSGLEGSLLHSRSPTLSSWEARSWSEVPMEIHRRVCRENVRLKAELVRTRRQLQAQGTSGSMPDDGQPPQGARKVGMFVAEAVSNLFGKK